MRLRIHRSNWPRLALVLTDTPRPDCPDCQGIGGHNRDYGDYSTGEYAGTEWDPCPCWEETRRWVLLPLPRRLSWRGTSPQPQAGAYSDEPPF
ncbi:MULTISPECIES: hypothetical protein [unclassified Streptomyces]|uniref:hypothetical protein n=1 Tax=unclassified Streptomyces TaxID=2593676 RepID=UPI002E33A5CC|nr:MULTISPECIES: hypothetical protein [unclassified Streptomyces]WUC65879.1 hypothetical protein OG861_17440 [Streptomyces sp. NBC_00539]